jgi:ATP-binding cassette subfamily B multidrug efflux pump
LTDPCILILDEATSNVDSLTESLIQDALRNLLRGRSAVVIAHRLSTVRNADRICVVQDGQIVEQGKHEELLARGGVYTALYNRQFTD